MVNSTKLLARAYLGLYPLTLAVLLTEGFSLSAPLMLVVAPTAFVVLRLKTIDRASYAMFIAQASLTAMTAALTTYFAQTAWPITLLIMASAISVVVMFAHEDVRTPYWLGRKSGMRRHPRRRVALNVGVTMGHRHMAAETYDLSEGGAYLVTNVAPYAAGDKLSIELRTRTGSSLMLRASVVSVNPNGIGEKPAGIGVELNAVSDLHRKKIRQMFSSVRRHHRYMVSLPLQLYAHGRCMETTTVDLSEGGCFIGAIAHDLAPGDRVMAHLHVDAHTRLELLAEVVWRTQHHDGIALHFTSMAKTDRTALRARLLAQDVAIQTHAA